MKAKLKHSGGFDFLKNAEFPITVEVEKSDLLTNCYQVHKDEFLRLGFHPVSDENKPYFLFTKDEFIF